MSGMALIIAAALLTGLAALGVLIWALSSGQYDDMEGDAMRILNDDHFSQGGAGAMPRPPPTTSETVLRQIKGGAGIRA
jgi:cbb3-type cytochrome oxidase maturation protein